MHSCGVVIMDLLVDRCCFSFSIGSLWFPARRCDISGTVVVPLVVFVVTNSYVCVSLLAELRIRTKHITNDDENTQRHERDMCI